MNNGDFHIFYINLDRRRDRREEIEAELCAAGLCGERFAAIDRAPGFVGCAESHLAVLKLAKTRGYTYTLILEDDFVFLLDPKPLIRDLLSTGPNSFDVCMLSYNMLQEESIVDKSQSKYRRVIEAQTASGYLVAGHYLDTLIQLYEKTNPLLAESKANWLYANDQCWKRLQRRDMWIYVVERAGKQRPSWSDTGGFFVDCGC
jgi:glycosyl transferase family 25